MDGLLDDKDWTWVLESPCPDCGFDAGAMPLGQARELLNAAASITFGARIHLVIEQENPTFSNWDQNAAAIESRYDQQEPEAVAKELRLALVELLHVLDAIPNNGWERPALRSNGSRFTLASLVRYLVHDPIHHAHDVDVDAERLRK